MDERVLAVVKKIRNNIENVEDIQRGSGEYYFKFKGTAFSITPDSKDTYLFYIYPRWEASTLPLIKFMSGDADPETYVMYKPDTAEEFLEMDMLYSAIRKKFLNLDSVLNSLLDPSTDPLPF